MKIYILDGYVLCGYGDNGKSFKTSYAESNAGIDKTDERFLSLVRFTAGDCFDGFYQNALRLRISGNAVEDYKTLSNLLSVAAKMDIEISPDVSALCARYEEEAQVEYTKLVAAQKAEEEAKKRQEQWDKIKLNGCLNCSDCKRTGDDDYRCGSTSEDLPVKNCPGYVGIIYQLFNYKPFPTDNCPFNFENKNKGVSNV